MTVYWVFSVRVPSRASLSVGGGGDRLRAKRLFQGVYRATVLAHVCTFRVVFPELLFPARPTSCEMIFERYHAGLIALLCDAAPGAPRADTAGSRIRFSRFEVQAWLTQTTRLTMHTRPLRDRAGPEFRV